MLMPKRTKYRRPHRLSYEGRAKGGRSLAFGEYGLVALEGAYVSNRQIEAARVAMTRYMNRGGQVWIKIFPDKPVTEKDGSPSFRKAVCCLKSVVWTKPSHVKRYVWPATSCVSKPNSSKKVRRKHNDQHEGNS